MLHFSCSKVAKGATPLFDDWKSIVASLFFSVIGMYFIGHGKRRLNYTSILIGAALLFYSYFIHSALWVWIIGIILTTMGWLTRW